jgi:hypothetical protein
MRYGQSFHPQGLPLEGTFLILLRNPNILFAHLFGLLSELV